MDWALRFHPLGPRDVVTQISSLGFDASVWELWPALCAGAHVRFVPDDVRGDPRALSRWLESAQPRLSFASTPVVEAMISDGAWPRVPGAMSAGGDRLTRRPPAGGGPVLNLYGPTECTCIATAATVESEPVERPPDIGRPISNIRVRILDSRLNRAPVGVPGELCIGGPGLARGYLGRPGLTAERFVPDPFSGVGERLYRTGDLARWTSGGRIEFLGRADEQVQVRGHRVEPGEVRAALESHPEIRQAVVVPRVAAGTTTLAAYVVGRGEAIDDVRAHALRALPEWMMPSSITPLDELPLTASGKVDRDALPEPLAAAPMERIEPRTGTELAVARVFADVLAVPVPGATDDFFALGGHSLAGAQVISRIRDRLSVELPLRFLFEASTVQGLSALVDASVRTTDHPVVPVPRDGELPLSFPQSRLWIIDQFDPGSSVYNVSVAIRLRGDLRADCLEAALDEIVRRHEALRTTFDTVRGAAVQRIAESLPLRLRSLDVSYLDASEVEQAALREAVLEAERPFDLSLGPLLRATLVRLSGTDHLLVLAMHHIVSDGWSMGVFVRELSGLYEAFIDGRASPLEPLQVQYADYAAWQRERLSGDVLREHLDYWRRALEGVPASIDLPSDRPRPPIQTFDGASIGFDIQGDVSAAVDSLALRTGATPFMVLVAAYATMLHRMGAGDEIVIGSPIAGRNRAEVEPLIGFFINTLVLRVDLSGNPTFEELIGRVKEMALGAFAHQDLPFEKLVEELKPPRDLSTSPLFQVVFALQNAPLPDLDLPGLEADFEEVEPPSAKFELSMDLSPSPDGYEGAINFNTTMFDRDTIHRFARQYKALLQSVAVTPAARVAELELLSDEDRRTVVESFNDTSAPRDGELALHEQVASFAALDPGATALFSGRDLEVTYGELDRRANRLARLLLARGARVDSPVGVLLPRGADVVVAMLGVMKSGAAYLPLDPAYPRRRLDYMLDDARPSLVVTTPQLRELVQSSDAICLDDPALDEQPDTAPDVAVHPDSLAYVIYTSGSTGHPKAVMVPHSGLMNLSRAMAETFGLGSGDRVLQFAPIGFDASVYEMLLALSSGGSLRVGTGEPLMPGPDLHRVLSQDGVTVATVVASALSVTPAADLPHLRLAGTAGEPCSPELLSAWSHGRRFFNLYGPTETAIWATGAELRVGDEPVTGRPIRNTTVYVLDSRMRPVPVGTPGELYIGGAGVARGYLGRSSLTAERFVPDPFSRTPGSRLYRTGDLGRHRSNGSIAFLGRTDEQVKVRGHRIELGEVEAALSSHPQVVRCAVAARSEGDGTSKLVGYVVASPDDPPGASALRAHMADIVPEWMIPSVFVLLDELPLSAHGKVDRKALPAPQPARPDLEAEYTPPRNDAQRAFADIWASVLRLDKVGIYDNFFDLGGDSMAAIRIVAKANEAGLPLTPKILFQNQTIADLARVETVGFAREAEQGVLTGPVPLTPVQRWFFDTHGDDPHHFNQAVMLAVSDDADPDLLRRALQAVADHHDALRLRAARTADGWAQRMIEPGQAVPLEVVGVKGLSEEQRLEAVWSAAERAHGSIDVTDGPVVRAVLFDAGDDGGSRLLLVVHHLCVDALSWPVLLEDLDGAYESLDAGDPVEMPPKTTSFRWWASRLDEYAQSPKLAQELDFWLGSITQDVPPLPVDRSDGVNTVASAQIASVVLDAEKTRSLLTRVKSELGAQPQEVLLAALARAVADWTGAGGVLLDLEGHGRHELFDAMELSGTVGWFTAVYPLWVPAPESPGDLEPVVRRLREIPNGGLGYGVLRYLSESEPRLASLPQAQISFNYFGSQTQPASGLTWFTPLDELTGPARSPDSVREHLLEFTCAVVDDELAVDCAYSESLHEPGTVQALCESFVQALRATVP
ncbi:MAG TPA: amino acid adenylation domain-containing protein [Actinomycetota bacterium]|nr:amino acid adenylation domain-containing protein [Actinomycetota bacterium]